MLTERLPRKCENDPFAFSCSPLLQMANDVADDEHEGPFMLLGDVADCRPSIHVSLRVHCDGIATSFS